MNLIAAMSLAGSILLLVYYLEYFVLKKRFIALDRDILLKISMIFFLCPVQVIKYYLPGRLEWYISGFFGSSEKQFYDLSNYVIVPIASEKYMMLQNWKVIYVVAGGFVAAGFVFYQLKKYFQIKKLLAACSEHVPSTIWVQLVNDPDLRDLCRKRNIKVVKTAEIQTPFVLGVFHPMICLPEKELPQEEWRFIFSHEIAHIRRRDVMVKWIGLIIILMHWFNPLSYLLLGELNKVSEYRCDEIVLRTLGDDKRGKYARLIVYAAAERQKDTGMWCSSLRGRKKDIYNRVEAIMERKKRNRGLGIIFMSLAVVLSSSISVYAYQAEKTVENEVEENIDWRMEWFGADIDDDNVIAVNENREFETDGISLLDFSYSDSVFIDSITEEMFCLNWEHGSRVNGRACMHEYVSGRIAQHRSDGKGGCTVSIYGGKRCTKCGHSIKSELISQTRYITCPH